MFWLGSATLAARLVDAASSIVVLGALTGAQLGLATLALTVVAFLEGFNSLGLNNVLVQRASVTAEEVASVWWYVLAVSALMTFAMLFSAPLLARVYGAPELEPLIRFASLKLLLVGLASVPLALLNRALRFKQVATIMAGSTVLSASITITLALNGGGAWAPLVGNTAHGLFQLLGAMLLGSYRPRGGFAWRRIASMARDGVKLAGAISIGQLTRNLDYLILGKVTSLGALGTYRVAFDLAMMPSMIVLQVVNRASLPIYARIAGAGGDLSPAFARTLKLIALLVVPPLLVAALGAETLMDLLNKAYAGDISPVVVCLCVAAWLRGLSQCTPALLIGAGQATRALIQALTSVALLAAAILLGLAAWPDADPLLVTAGAWVVSTALQLGVNAKLVRSTITLRRSWWASATLVPAAVALVTAAAVLALRRVLRIEPPALALAVDTAAMLAIFGLILRYGLKIRGLRELRPGSAAAPVMPESTQSGGSSP